VRVQRNHMPYTRKEICGLRGPLKIVHNSKIMPSKGNPKQLAQIKFNQNSRETNVV
jgi:hypothetical protein